MAEDKKQGGEKEPRLDHMRKRCPLYDFVWAAFVSPANTKRQTIKLQGSHKSPATFKWLERCGTAHKRARSGPHS
jgi:hypothetical protein